MLQGVIRSWLALTSIAAGCLLMLTGGANAVEGQPTPWALGFQPGVTTIMEQISEFHDFIFYIITAITVFVLGLLVIVMVRFNEKANPTPSKNSHNTLLEVVWTVVPILILVAIAIPSFRLLFAQYDFPKADLTIKAVGNQWYWTYEYPDADEMTFDSILLEGDDLKEAQKAGRIAPRLLAVDNDVVVPVNKVVQVLVTASDVIHNWTIPAFGVKIDAVPGRILRTWFKAEKTGIFFGQCSELCGIRHAFMPIAVRVVTEEEYAEWLEKAKAEFASNNTTPAKERVAAENSPDGRVAALEN